MYESGLDIDGDGNGAEHPKIPDIIKGHQEIQLILRTINDGMYV